ncbi:MAG: TlpA disulfide reductase family protein [Hydrogenoanaerobacterium sp.]
MKKIMTLLLALTMVLSLAACGSKNSTKSVAKTPLGDFSAQDFEGNTITKDIFADYDLTMVNLWATTCGYCIEEMPALNELRKELQDEGKSFNIISICMDIGSTDERKDANFEKAKEIIKTTGVEYTNLIPDSVLLEGRLKGIQAYPESFFVDSEGNVVSKPYVGTMPKKHWKVTMNNEIEKISQNADKE